MSSVKPVQMPPRPQLNASDNQIIGKNPPTAASNVKLRRNLKSPAPIKTPSRANTTPASGCIITNQGHAIAACAYTRGSELNHRGTTCQPARISTPSAAPNEPHQRDPPCQ